MDELIEQIKLSDDLINSVDLVESHKDALIELVEPYISKQKSHIDNENIYTRDCVFSNENFEIILITWYKGSESPIHDHAENGCLMFLLNGVLLEERFDPVSGNMSSLNIIRNKNVNYIHNREAFHRISNKTDETVHSIHVYSPPKYSKL